MDEKVDPLLCAKLLSPDACDWTWRFDATDQLRALLAERERHLADVQRLDWLDSHPSFMLHKFPCEDSASIGCELESGSDTHYAPTVRAALDASRQAAIAVAEGGK